MLLSAPTGRRIISTLCVNSAPRARSNVLYSARPPSPLRRALLGCAERQAALLATFRQQV